MDKLIKVLSDEHDHNINNVNYYYIGKGMQGSIYSVNGEYAIKIYTNTTIEKSVIEFYILGMVKELKIPNIINIIDFTFVHKYPILSMELVDGDLNKWRLSKHTDNDWMSMIFQVCYGIISLNRLKVLHNDATLTNIFYNNNDKALTYNINSKIYKIPGTYIFKIGDFGQAHIIGSKYNKLSDDEIRKRIHNRHDLYKLSTMFPTIAVNYIIKDYTHEELFNIAKSHKDFKQQYYKERDIQKKRYRHYKDSVYLAMHKFTAYFIMENNIIPFKYFQKKYSFIVPSDEIIDILNKIMTETDIFGLFNKFLS